MTRSKQGQGSALDPQKARGPLNPLMNGFQRPPAFGGVQGQRLWPCCPTTGHSPRPPVLDPATHGAASRRARAWAAIPGWRSRIALLALGSIALTAPGHAQGQAETGAYLAYVTGCVSCHSPHDPAGHIPDGRLLAGGDHPIHTAEGGGVYPPNITPDPATGIGGWSDQDIVATLHDGRTPDGGILSAAMPWRTQFSALTDADALAIARYVRSVAPVRTTPPAAPKGR
jgi:hypothetical protein